MVEAGGFDHRKYGFDPSLNTGNEACRYFGSLCGSSIGLSESERSSGSKARAAD